MQRTRARSMLLVTGSGLLLLAAFLVYYLNQAPPPKQALPATGPSAEVLTLKGEAGKSPIGPGSGVWMDRYDPDTGQRVARYRADQYTPRKDGRIDVVNPEAEFFSRNGADRRVIRVRGKTGVFTAEPSLTSSNRVGEKQTMQPPSRGELHDVTIVVSQPGDPDTAAFTLTLNNAAFDNDEFTVVSEAYVDPATQQRVEADDVPVVGIGADYDFYGRGLIVKWNDRERRLESLEVSHGDHLVVKHPGTLDIAPQTPPPATASATTTVAAAPAPAPATAPRPPALYRATFLDNVRVTQGDEELVTAQRMLADFVMDDNSSTAATNPATQPAVAGPATAPSGAVAAAAAAPPVVVHWTGPMRVQPLSDSDAGAQTVITFQGAPVVAHQQNASIRCASLSYRVADAVLAAHDAHGVPVVVARRDLHGLSIIDCAQLNYARRTQVAVLTGAGKAHLPAATAGPGRPDEHLQAEWSRSCTVQLLDNGQGQMVPQHADLEGDVKVDHPQLKLQAQALALDFQPPQNAPDAQGPAAPEASLRELHAAGGVHCDMIDRDQTQTIDSDALHVVMAPSADGRLLPHTVTADGHVRTRDPERRLSADHLAMTLAPAQRPAADTPSVQLETLDARQDVRVDMKDGSVAQGDTLAIRRVDAHQTARLTGTPTVAASITQAGNSLAGALIDAWPDDQRVVVTGPGTMHGVQQASAAQRAVDVDWTNSASYNGRTDLVLAAGDVHARSVDPADGAVQTASGQSMTMHLAAAPTTAPATQSASGMLAGKAVRDITFADGAQAGSVLLRPDGSVLKRQLLLAATFTYTGPGTDAAPGGDAGRSLSVPVPGRMLVEDHRPAAATAPAGPGAEDPGNERGATAFAWSDSMSYDEAAHLMQMRGDAQHPVVVAHRDDGPNPPVRRLSAWNIWADLEPSAAGQAGADIRTLHARGGVLLNSADDRLICDDMTYDPATRLVTARGSDTANALFTQQAAADKAPQVISAEELRWDTRQDLPRAIDADIQLRR